MKVLNSSRVVDPQVNDGRLSLRWDDRFGSTVMGFHGRRKLACVVIVGLSSRTEYWPEVYPDGLRLERIDNKGYFKTLAGAKRWCERALMRDWSGL